MSEIKKLFGVEAFGDDEEVHLLDQTEEDKAL